MTDDQGVTVTCPGTDLAPGASMTCTATGTVQPGQYANVGTVDGDAAGRIDGRRHRSEPLLRTGAGPGEETNGVDADSRRARCWRSATPVTWTYKVTNPGPATVTGHRRLRRSGGDRDLPGHDARRRRVDDLHGHRHGAARPVRQRRHRHRDAACRWARSRPPIRATTWARFWRREVDQRRRRRHATGPGPRRRGGRHLDLRRHQRRQQSDHQRAGGTTTRGSR